MHGMSRPHRNVRLQDGLGGLGKLLRSVCAARPHWLPRLSDCDGWNFPAVFAEGLLDLYRGVTTSILAIIDQPLMSEHQRRE